MSIDSLSLIIENAYACKFTDWHYGKVIHFQLNEGDDWQRIELAQWVWDTLVKRYRHFIEKWERVE